MWKLHGSTATFTGDGTAATVDLDQPQRGLCEVVWNDAPLIHAALLQVGFSGPFVHTDAYVRGRDLIVSYRETPERGYGLQVYWSIMADRGSLTLDTLVSVQTSSLVTPRICVVNEVSANQAFAYRGGDRDAFEPAGAKGVESPLAPLVLVRSAEHRVSLAQMIQPQHFTGPGQIQCVEGCVRLQADLFHTPLEKGVIRRGRIRCLLCAADGAESSSVRAYHDFASGIPPLTT